MDQRAKEASNSRETGGAAAGSGSGSEPDYHHVATLIDQLRHEDAEVRLGAIQNVPLIASALGPQRTRGELIPFLTETTDDEDEILLAMAEKLGLLVSSVGGAAQAYNLLGPLELLAGVEEPTVRDKAVESLKAVVSQMEPVHVGQHFMPALRRLAQKEGFTARISACGLFGTGYAHLSPAAKEELRNLFSSMCKDDTPMVRRVAAGQLGSFAQQVDAVTVERELMPLFSSLTEDEQDSVRLQCVGNCVALARLLSPSLQHQLLLPIALKTTTDPSWRVRWAVANKFSALCSAVGADICNTQLSVAYERLLQDPEAEVRTAAVFVVTEVAEHMEVQVVMSKVFPCLQQLVLDGCDHVRAALAAASPGLARKLGLDPTVQALLPLLLALLRDENAEVRLNVIAKLESINQVVGVDLLSQSLLPAIVDLAEDNKWRVRLAIIEHIPILAKQLGPSFFNEKLCDICLSWLGDDVHAIRVAATVNLKQLAAVFGSEWSRSRILPKLVQMGQQDKAFLHRMTSLYAIQVLSEVLSPSVLEAELLPLVLDMSQDPVANVRFTVSKTLQRLASALNEPSSGDGSGRKGKIAPTLQTLSKDKDRDVRYYAREAIQSVSAH